MTRRFRMNAERAQLFELALGDRTNQGPRHVGVVGVGAAAKRSTRVGILVARDPLAQAELERLQIEVLVVRHVTFST